MEELWRDLRQGARALMKTPGFTLVALVTLALGVGANTVIFTIVNSVLLRPLPYPESERLMQLGMVFPSEKSLSDLSEPKFVFLRDNIQSFEAITAFQELGPNAYLTDENATDYIRGLAVSGDFFRVVGVFPQEGREFTPEEDSPGGQRVVILSDALWRQRFGADPEIVGATIVLNGANRTVVGIMPPQFEFMGPQDVFIPIRINPANQNEGNNYTVIGRLKPDATADQARTELKHLFQEFQTAHPKSVDEGEVFTAMTWRLSMTAEVRELLWILLGAVGFVLLIACVNITNLQLVRGMGRQKEIAIRRALGAGTWRLIRQLVTESLLLAVAGGAVGVLLASVGVRTVLGLVPEGLIPRAYEIHVDWRVLAFTLGATLLTGTVFGVAPALQALRFDFNQVLKKGLGTRSKGNVGLRFLGVLVVVEVALALVLTIGAGLLLRTFAKLSGVEPGFDARNVLSFEISPRGKNYDTVAKLSDFYQRTLEDLSQLPGVQSVAFTNKLPLDSQFNMPYRLSGQTQLAGSSQYRLISPDYFQVMKMPLRQGRAFQDTDRTGGQQVAIVNEVFARSNFEGLDPIGQQVFVCCEHGDLGMRQIVGVVSETKQKNLSEAAPSAVFIPIAQADQSVRQVIQQASLVVRTESDPSRAMADVIVRQIRRLDSRIPIRNIRPLQQLVARSLAPQRFNLILVASFSMLGLVLAGVGIYGVIAYSVSQRTYEIGLRMALGAHAFSVLKLIMKQGMTFTLLGIAIGLIASIALTRLMASLLFGVGATDEVTFVLVSMVLAMVALLACFVPAWRATKVEPMVALRYE
jgi:putative ABC transport system permease protein